MLTRFVQALPAVAVAAASLFAGGMAAAAPLLTFQNGGFEGYNGNKNSFNSATPPGWTTTAGTPDVFNANTTFSGHAWKASSTGGDFLHGIGWDGNNYVESALQVGLAGLEIGKQYEISFEQSISFNNFAAVGGGGYWQIIFGAESHNAEAMLTPASGVAVDWDWQTLIFTATSEVQTLEVVAHSTFGSRADLGIDSFFIGDPGTNPDNPDNPDDPSTNVPTPASLPLVGLALVGLAMASRRKRQGH
jgi:hypothetical protein